MYEFILFESKRLKEDNYEEPEIPEGERDDEAIRLACRRNYLLGQIVPGSCAEDSDCNLETNELYYFKDKTIDDKMEVENLIDDFLKKRNNDRPPHTCVLYVETVETPFFLWYSTL
jgi:hypothetical protein